VKTAGKVYEAPLTTSFELSKLYTATNGLEVILFLF